MLVNPGGPGGSGLICSILGVRAERRRRLLRLDRLRPARRRRQRPGAHLPAVLLPRRPAAVRPGQRRPSATWLKRSAGYATSCAQKNDLDLLSNMKTIDSAKDMDSLRKALGQPVINYYGFSYGTYLGQVYATLFPNRMRRMVLDSNVDPRNVWYEANLDQDVAFERNIKIWFALAREVRQRLPPRHDREGRRDALLQDPGRARQARGRRHRRRRRVERHLPVRRLLPVDLAGPRRHVRRLGQAPRQGQADRRVPRQRRPWGRQRVRHLQRRPVHRRPVAAEVGDLAEGQRPRRQDRAVRDLGQRLVQRAVPDLAGQGGHPGQGRRHARSRPSCSSTRRSTRRRRTRAASRCASCSRTRSCSPSRAAPRTPTRCSATSASTTPSPPTSPTARCRRARPGNRADAFCAPLPVPGPALGCGSSGGVGQGHGVEASVGRAHPAPADGSAQVGR